MALLGRQCIEATIQEDDGERVQPADMATVSQIYQTLYTTLQTVYDSGDVGDDCVTKTRTFVGSSSTSYTGTTFLLDASSQ